MEAVEHNSWTPHVVAMHDTQTAGIVVAVLLRAEVEVVKH